jgi:NAD(P)H dehydrogenase (quinone)
MKVLTLIANPNPKSFCHAVLREVTAGLVAGGHSSEVIDLYAERFDPVFRVRDFNSYVHESMPLEVLSGMNLRQRALDTAGGPVRRFLLSRLLANKDPRALAKLAWEHRPKDVRIHQEKVARAEGLAFIAPVFWLGFPAILKGWFERVFTYGNAYALTSEGWAGNIKGRVGLLQHEKALVISTTLFSEEDYKAGLEAPMRQIVDDFGLRYPGVKRVEHVYFYRVPVVDDAIRRDYLKRAFDLGKGFAEPSGAGAAAA